jgi:lactate dehydrogenase-like 2-hydroxyacid dehydrogenase
MPCLKIIVRMGVGYDNVDIVAAGKMGIAVYNIPGRQFYAVLELDYFKPIKINRLIGIFWQVNR